MSWESLRSDVLLKDPKSEYKSGVRIEQYRVSGNALFLPKEKYIPFDAVTKLQIRKSLLNSGHCCGMAFPVSNLVVFYGGERPQKVMLEKDKNAKKMADIILAARDSIVMEEYKQGDII